MPGKTSPAKKPPGKIRLTEDVSNELDKILEDIAVIQSRIKEDRVEIDSSSKNIDKMLTLLEG